MSSARSVAKELVHLSLSGVVQDPLTPYRLHTLLYYAQAWSLVLRDSEIFPDDIEADVTGPNVPPIATCLVENSQARFVCSHAFDRDPSLDDEDEATFLSYLWPAYAHLSPSGLFDMLQTETPLLKAKQESATHGRGLVNMNDLRESFMRRQGMPAPLEAYRCLRLDREKEAELAILCSPPLDAVAIWKNCRSVTPSARKK